MPTTVGTESDVKDLVQNLLTLEHDAIAAYESTIEKLDDGAARSQVEQFRADHLGHVDKLRALATRIGAETPEGGDMKQLLTTGKIALANLAGDGAILKAMKTNEDETVQAYEQASGNASADAEMKAVFTAALEDEKRHRLWMESQA